MGLHDKAFDCGVIVDTEVLMVDESGMGTAPEAALVRTGPSAFIDGELDAGALEVLATLVRDRARRDTIAFGAPESIRRTTAAAVELFPTSRMFRDTSGWFVNLRAGDREIVSRLKVPGYHCDGAEGLVVGPFATRELLERWLGAFLVLFGDGRDDDCGELGQPPGPALFAVA